MLASVRSVEPHPSSIMIGTGKGGVGKSTIAVHLAGYCAAVGEKTLLVCVTSQEDDDLGIARFGRGLQPDGAPVLDGAGLYRALHDRSPVAPVREVRPNLDVVPGGAGVADLLKILMLRTMDEGAAVALSLAYTLESLFPKYDRIILDSAPENDPLEQLAGAASRWLFIPTKSDDSSIRGLHRIARNYRAVRQQVNPTLRVGGAFLYNSNPSASALHAEVRTQIKEILGEKTPTLSTVVGNREVPAAWARRRGLLFWEAEAMLRESPRSYDVAAGRAQRADLVPESVVGLARDMRALCLEILTLSESEEIR